MAKHVTKTSTITPDKTAVVESPITVGGLDPNAPKKTDWELSQSPSPEEQAAQSKALAAELAAQK
jgi:hypothetical protein